MSMDQKQVVDYLKNANIDIQSAGAVFFLADFVFSFYVDSHERHKVHFSPACSYFSCKNLDVFFQMINKDSLMEVNENVYNDYIKDKESLDEKIKSQQNLTEKLDNIWKKYCIAKKEGLGEKELKIFFEKLYTVSRQWWYYGVIGEDKGAIIERKIIPSFAKRNGISVSDAQNLVSIMSHPEEQVVFNLERKEFLQICVFVLKNNLKEIIEKGDVAEIFAKYKDLKRMIDLYLEHYFWIKTDFATTEEVTEKSLFKDIGDELNKKTAKEIESELLFIDASFRKIEDEKEEIIRNCDFTDKDKGDIYFAKRTVYWIDQRKLGMMKNIYYIFHLLNDIASYHNIKYSDITLYTAKEMQKLLNSGKKVSEQELTARHDGIFTVYQSGDDTTFFYGNVAEEMLRIATHVEQEDVKGIVASKGVSGKSVKGRVRVVSNPNQSDFADGEILVTSMTRVEYVPLMRKAKAIITNEGGLACHAAIVSRELGVPAIIGTQNATDLLQDGEYVELNLETGAVRKLS